ncbi:ead/Ea22-like family protein [Serratia marcescens]|nr:ead/Ea22-like family protein [Serratia marcescens]
MDKFSELKAVAEKAKELAGINNYKKGKDAIAAFKAAANPAAILALLAELEAKDKHIAELENESLVHRHRAYAAENKVTELQAKLATPVRLPDVLFIKVSGSAVPVMHADRVKERVHAAGFTVEGDE